MPQLTTDPDFITGECPECKAAGIDHNEIVARAKKSPLDAGIVLGGFKFMDNDFHWAINTWFMDLINEGERRFIIVLPRNHCKDVALDTKIPTPLGWTTMGEIQVGDYVYSEAGEPTRVTHTSEVFTDNKCYEVTFSNGQKIVAGEHHNWLTTARVDRPGGGRNTSKTSLTRVRTTKELKDTLHYGKRRDRNHSVAMPGPIECQQKSLMLDPHVLGMWLGDGTSIRCTIHSGPQDLEHHVQKLKEAGFTPKVRQKDSCFDISFYGGTILSELGVKGNKHIPRQYLRASKEQRLKLLQGLMDTDGTVNKTGDVLSYTTISDKLANGFCELISTFGIKYSIKKRQGKRDGEDFGKPFYTIQFHVHRDRLEPFSLKRKLDRMQWEKNLKVAPRSRTVQIVDIKEVPTVKTRCIAVDAPSHLFLCGETMLPTHNTFLLGICYCMWRLAQDANQTVLYRMASTTNAEKSLSVIESTFRRSETVKHFFPRLVPFLEDSEDWTSNASTLCVPRSMALRDNSVEAKGITSRVTGMHANTILNDDLIDEVTVYSDVYQQRAISAVKNTDTMMQDQGKDIEIIIGTMWAGQFYEFVLEPGYLELFNVVILGARVDDRFRKFLASIGKKTIAKDGDPIWPERFTREILDEMEKKDRFHFQTQMLNLRLTEEGQRFFKEDFRYFQLDGSREFVTRYVKDRSGEKDKTTEVKTMVKDLQLAMFIDPATGESKRTDESAIILTGYDPETSLVYVLHEWGGRPLPHALIAKIFEVAGLWPTLNNVYIEEVAFQTTLKHFFRQEMQRRNKYYNVKRADPGGRKKGIRIIDSLQPYISNHQVYFLRHQRKLLAELEHLQIIDGKVIGKSPNRVDALSYGPLDWRGTMRNYDMADIPFEQPKLKNGETKPAYDLSCET